mmetsp:Transcript_16112/g.55023  ORF Transcript_16112/g.55023 Transcript_16112/m.55023 type:complete len:133 (-) Transcript_16112:715-1113(-)
MDRLLGAWQSAPEPELLTFVDDEVACGLGCRFLRLTAALLVALDERRVLTLSPAAAWFYAANCTHNHDCFFEPLARRASTLRLSLNNRPCGLAASRAVGAARRGATRLGSDAAAGTGTRGSGPRRSRGATAT